MHEPDITQYPLWLRELIFPTELMNCRAGRQQHMEFERSLRRVFDNRRDPLCDVLSEVTIENIRYRFRFYEFQKRITEQRNEIYDLTTRLEKLEKKMKKLTKKEKA